MDTVLAFWVEGGNGPLRHVQFLPRLFQILNVCVRSVDKKARTGVMTERKQSIPQSRGKCDEILFPLSAFI